MKQIAQTDNEHHWPRHEVKQVECRKRDLVIRIADWTRTKEEPSFDVECYIGGVYDWHESHVFSTNQYGTKAQAKAAAIDFAKAQIAKLL